MRHLVLLAAAGALCAGLSGAPGPRITSYTNPIIPGFHPDPSIVRVGEDYYLVTSTFEFFPGVPVFHSRDLVHWRLIGHALTRDSQLPLERAGASGGIFAPTIRYHDGTFYMITTNVTAGGNFYVTATNPAGPWSEPIWVRDQGGIDPSLFFDQDGTVYLTSNGSTPGAPSERGIYTSVIDVATGRLRTSPRLVWRGTGGRYPEGPHLYRLEKRYYLLISEGGTEYGHMVTIARSDSPWGPFEPCPRNPILTHRNTHQEQPTQGTGHADLVQDHEGRWWMVFLAFRPQNGMFHHLGRETYLAPVTWDGDGWPIVNGGQPVPLEVAVAGLPARSWPTAPVRREFDGPLDLEWAYLRNPDRAAYSLSERPGWLGLRGRAATLADEAAPTFVGRRQEHLSVRVSTRVAFDPTRPGEEAGLTVFHNGQHRYDLVIRRGVSGREAVVRQTIGPFLSAVTASTPLGAPGTVDLEVVATPTEYAFFATDASGTRRQLGRASSRYVSSEVAGGFTGVFFGLYATGTGSAALAPAYFDWFEYSPSGAR